MVVSARSNWRSTPSNRLAFTKTIIPAENAQTISASTPACQSVKRVRTLSGRSLIRVSLPRTNPTPRTVCSSFGVERIVDLAAQPRHGDVDDVVERRGARAGVPHLAGEHLSRNDVALVAQQALEDLELLPGQFQRPLAPRHLSRGEIHAEVFVLQVQGRIARTRGAAARGSGRAARGR